MLSINSKKDKRQFTLMGHEMKRRKNGSLLFSYENKERKEDKEEFVHYTLKFINYCLKIKKSVECTI